MLRAAGRGCRQLGQSNGLCLLIDVAVVLFGNRTTRSAGQICESGENVRIIKKRSFNLLCVLDLFSERWQSTLFQIFLD